MQVLIDIRLLNKGGQSGIEEYATQIVNHLSEEESGHRWQLFYQGWKKAPLPDSWLLNSTIKVINWQCPNKIFDILRPKVDRFIKTDLVYSPHINIIRTNNVPHIITVHDLSFIHHPYFFSLKHRLWHKMQSYKKQIRNSSLIVTDSNYTKNDLIETLNVTPKKVVVIYPGVNPQLKKIQNASHPKINYPYILYLGTLEPRKNINLLVRAFDKIKQKKLFRDFKLILAGNLGWLYKKVLKEIETAENKKDIVVWGRVSSEEKIILYNLAEAFVYPSFFEGFGFPPLEAQSCGCPVIASNRTSLPEILGESAILVDPWKIDQLAETIESVLTNQGLRNNLIKLGYENSQRFNWKKTACEVLKLFRQFSS